MTMFDKVVATDLAVLGADSRQRMGSLVAMMPKPAPIVVEPVVDPACSRANRVAGIAAGIAAIGCGAALAVLPSRPMFISHWNPEVVPSIHTNVWFLVFIAVAIVASTFLVAHRIALHRSPELSRRARGVGDLVFGSVAIAWVVTWFVVCWQLNDMPELFFSQRYMLVWKSVRWDERVDPYLALAGGLACALFARGVAVSLANHVSDRWRGSSLTVLVKIAAVTLLVTVFGLCVFDPHWAGQFGWEPIRLPHPDPGGYYAHGKLVHTMNLVAQEYEDPLSDTQWTTLYVIVTMTVLGAILALACVRERYMKVPSRWLIAIEHVTVIPLATACVVVALLRLGWSESDNVVYPPLPATIALVTILISHTLRRRRAQLTQSTPAPAVASPAPRPSP